MNYEKQINNAFSDSGRDIVLAKTYTWQPGNDCGLEKHFCCVQNLAVQFRFPN
jgi:hypothetical protein